jgi:hypothetical protein
MLIYQTEISTEKHFELKWHLISFILVEYAKFYQNLTTFFMNEIKIPRAITQ